ncbi:MAG: hypothetical protein IKP69_12305 [Oscillospiraceae bacterium]|nr:hypothetical protein [Oscillospiraceae bacterium]
MEEKQKAGVFRKKSLETISSPEQLTDYLRVTNPSVWLILFAVILLLGGLFVWSSAGQLETIANGTAVVENGTAQIMMLDTAQGQITSGMTVRIGSSEFEISTTEQDEYGRTIAYAPATVADGKYDVKVVVESISPISFLFS